MKIKGLIILKLFINKCLFAFRSLSSAKMYFILSCFVTVVDYVVLFILHRLVGIEIVVSNTIAVITGFILHYLMGSNTVFKTPYGIFGFLVYLTTFLMGLFLADVTIKYTVELMVHYFLFSDTINMTAGKFISIIVPYFFMYYLRKWFFEMLGKQKALHK